MKLKKLSFIEAINETLFQIMKFDKNVIVYGLDVDDNKGINGSTLGLQQKYGKDRVFGTPLSEDSMTGIGVGMALSGLRPIHIHIRADFLLLCMNQIVNMAAKIKYVTSGQLNVPIIIRAVIGKSWGQGSQHSQSLFSLFTHIPGLMVVAPSIPYDAKACLLEAYKKSCPVIFIEHRLAHNIKGNLPINLNFKTNQKARILTRGNNITIIGISYLLHEALKAAKILKSFGISCEVIDPIWLRPLDKTTIISSVKKTKKVLILENDWLNSGIASEIGALLLENIKFKFVFRRMGFQDTVCPPTPSLEKLFYPSINNIIQLILKMLNKKNLFSKLDKKDFENKLEEEFKGPF